MPLPAPSDDWGYQGQVFIETLAKPAVGTEDHAYQGQGLFIYTAPTPPGGVIYPQIVIIS